MKNYRQILFLCAVGAFTCLLAILDNNSANAYLAAGQTTKYLAYSISSTASCVVSGMLFVVAGYKLLA